MGSTIRRAIQAIRRDESGFGLIEVIVSAMLVVLVSLGVYLGLDAASATSGLNKHRSVATSVAQQDQDRMRAMAVDELSNYRETLTSTVGAVTYTVQSRADWVTDSTGTASCAAGTAKASYLRISSSVTWPSMKVAPVTIESISAAPAGSFGSGEGSLAVQVRDRDGAAVSGVVVSLTGAKSYTDVTNAAGCVLWGYLPVGRYTVTVSKAGLIGSDGSATPSQPVDVVGEATTTLAFDYDVGGRIDAHYQTWDGRAVVAVPYTTFTAKTSSLTVPLPAFGDGVAHETFLTALVFPYTAGYGVYAGNCAGNDPTLYSQAAQMAMVTPGANATVNLRVPPVMLKVVNGSTAIDRAIVKLTGTASGCGVLPQRTTASDGFLSLADRALPYGTYTFCVQADIGGVKRKTSTRTGATTLSNTSPTGIPSGDAATVDMSTGTLSGACP